MKSKGKDSAVLQEKEWKCELACLADVAAYLNFLNQFTRHFGDVESQKGNYDLFLDRFVVDVEAVPFDLEWSH